MQQKSIGKQLWGIFSPILVKTLVALVVEFVVLFVHCMRHMPELSQIADQDLLMERTMEICFEILQYTVELSGVIALVTIPFLLLMIKKDKKKEREARILPNKKAPASKYALIVGISLPFALAANNIIMLSNLAAYSEAYQETAEVLYTPSLLIQILCLGIVIPIMEELIFRGLIYRRVRNSTTPIRAMICSALFFGVYHDNLVQTIYGVLCGLLLAYLYEKYGSLKAPVLAHMLMNILAVLFTEAGIFVWMFEQPIRMAVITIACAATASTVFLAIQKIEEKPVIEIPKEIEDSME